MVTMGDLETLRFRRQFLLAPRHCRELRDWQTRAIGKDTILHAHPDLAVTSVREAGRELTLIGYAIDAREPEADNEGVLRSLLPHAGDAQALIRATFSLAGRWVLILCAPERNILLHDAAGLRQVVYTARDSSERWCASQPGLIARQLRLDPDPEAQALRNELRERLGQKQDVFPGASTLFRPIRQLLPNHYLDLITQTSHRFFPTEPEPVQPMEVAAQKVAAMLCNLLRGAARRFPLALAVTAGLDSRMLLAASRDVSQDILYFTMVVPSLIPTMTEHSPDVAIPSRLLAKLGLEHTIFHCSPRMEDNALAQLFRQNVAAAHEGWGAIATSLFTSYPQERVLVNGNCSEIFRTKNYRNLDLNRTSASTMANFFGWGLGRNALVHRSMGEWTEKAKAACQKTGLDILVLQYWEQKMGRWAAQWTLECDLIHDVFMPFDCRELLVTALSVDWKLRSAISDFHLARRIAEILWPEVLSEPVNPASSWFERIKAKAWAKMRVRGFPPGYPASLRQKVVRQIDPYRC